MCIYQLISAYYRTCGPISLRLLIIICDVSAVRPCRSQSSCAKHILLRHSTYHITIVKNKMDLKSFIAYLSYSLPNSLYMHVLSHSFLSLIYLSSPYLTPTILRLPLFSSPLLFLTNCTQCFQVIFLLLFTAISTCLV